LSSFYREVPALWLLNGCVPENSKIMFGTSNALRFSIACLDFFDYSLWTKLSYLLKTQYVPPPHLPGFNQKCWCQAVWSGLAAEGWIVVQIYWKPIRKCETAVTWSKYQDRIAKGWRLWPYRRHNSAIIGVFFPILKTVKQTRIFCDDESFMWYIGQD